jgi:hypothetical protein
VHSVHGGRVVTCRSVAYSGKTLMRSVTEASTMTSGTDCAKLVSSSSEPMPSVDVVNSLASSRKPTTPAHDAMTMYGDRARP